MRALVTGAGSGSAPPSRTAGRRRTYGGGQRPVAEFGAAHRRPDHVERGTARAYAADVSDEGCRDGNGRSDRRDLGRSISSSTTPGLSIGRGSPTSPGSVRPHVRRACQGAYLCTRACLPAMLARSSHIVNIASQRADRRGQNWFTTRQPRRRSSAHDQGAGVRSQVRACGSMPLRRADQHAAGRGAVRTGKPPKRAGCHSDALEPRKAEIGGVVAFLCSRRMPLFVRQTLGPNSGDVML